jgi:N-acetyl-alpha-D-muramate 1-phosphate uridylyltransferase
VSVKSAMVMAAGLGTRMRPLTNDRPKPMVMLAGKPLLDHCLDQLRLAQIGKIVVNVHYLPEQVEAYLAAHAQDFDVHVSDERGLLLETGGGLVKAAPFLPEEPFFCINSDNIWIDGPSNSLCNLAAHWDGDMMDALLLVVPRERAHCHSGRGDFFVGDDGRLQRRGIHDFAPFVYIGIQLISHRLLKGAPDGPFSTNVLWDRAIANGRLYAIEHQGDWFDIGSPQAIKAALNAHFVANG